MTIAVNTPAYRSQAARHSFTSLLPVFLLTQLAQLLGGNGRQVPPHFAGRFRAFVFVHYLSWMVHPSRMLGLVTTQVALLTAGFTQLVCHIPGETCGLRPPVLMRAPAPSCLVTTHVQPANRSVSCSRAQALAVPESAWRHGSSRSCAVRARPP